MTPLSEPVLRRVRDYAIEEPSFTVAFAAWELGIHRTAIDPAVKELLRLGIVEEIEPRQGPYGAVYRYKEIDAETTTTPKQRRRLFAELDDSKLADIGIEAQKRGVVVPHTRIRGSTGRPGEDARRQARGVRMTRGKGK